MTYYVRYFAENPLTLKALGAAIKSIAPQYKIDGGDLMSGTDVLAEIGIDSAGSDLFNEELGMRIAAVDQMGGQAAQWVSARLRGVRSIVAVRVDPAIAWELLDPLWGSLTGMSTGLTHVEGQGYYDGSNPILSIA